MGKISRNDPCPCGSGKKFKKCCIDKPGEVIFKQPESPEAIETAVTLESTGSIDSTENTGPRELVTEQIGMLLYEGYSCLEGKDAVKACTFWLEAWEQLKLSIPPDAGSPEKLFTGNPYLYGWCQDLEIELEQAGREDISFFEKRIKYCQEFCSCFPEAHSPVTLNMMRAKAESFFYLGKPAQGEQAFKALLDRYPSFALGYINWGDMYWLNRPDKQVPPDYDKAERIYRLAFTKGAEHGKDVLDRLKQLEEARLRS